MNQRFIKVIALDFDGTLVSSNQIKDEAFETIFSDWKKHKEAMLSWHRQRNTVDRREKFRYFVEEVLKEYGNIDMVNSLVERFTMLTQEAIIECPWVDGALEFLSYFKAKIPIYLVSATPQLELDEITSKRGINNAFKRCFGSPLNKVEVLKSITDTEKVTSQEILYIGDSPEDQQAAEALKMNFMGIDSDRGLKSKNIFTNFHYLQNHLIKYYDC